MSECAPSSCATCPAHNAGNLKRLGEISAAIGPCPTLADLEARLASLRPDERERLDHAIERQRSHFASDGVVPADPHR